jgi:hypothetical protein
MLIAQVLLRASTMGKCPQQTVIDNRGMETHVADTWLLGNKVAKHSGSQHG